VEILKATVQDCTEIGSIHVQAVKNAYKDILPKSYYDSLSEKKRAAYWRIRFNGDPDVYVLKNHAEVLGFVEISNIKEKIEGYSLYGEISLLYLKPNVIGKGYGSMLLIYAEEALVKNGAEGIALWVVEKNKSAIEFFKRRGYSYSKRCRSTIYKLAKLAFRYAPPYANSASL